MENKIGKLQRVIMVFKLRKLLFKLHCSELLIIIFTFEESFTE